MKTVHKAIFVAILLATPFAAAQARDNAAHQRWLEAQKIDIKPTIKITETQIPADSAGSSSNYGAPATQAPGASMPSSGTPVQPSTGSMPSSGGYAPSMPPTPSTDGGSSTGEGMGSGMGTGSGMGSGSGPGMRSN